MKKNYLLLVLLTLTACGGTTTTIYQNSSLVSNTTTSLSAQTTVATSTQNSNTTFTITLNLTKYGLYNGEVGLSSETLFLENYITLDLKVGDALPKTEITSSLSGLEFVSWQYVNDEAGLDYTDKVVPGVTTYQAYFKSNNEGEDIGDDPIVNPNGERTIYFITNSNWESGNPQTNAYVWISGGSPKTTWPGTAMTFVENVGSGKKYSYTFETKYNYIIFCRSTNGSDFSNNGANQTSDIPIPSNYNTATINSGLKTVTWSNS